MAFAGMQILIFHLWIYIFNHPAEVFFKTTAVFGVDIFFFVSAYSLANREIDNCLNFIYARFKSVYLKFIIFAIIAAIVKGWKINYLFEVITTINLFKKGGGAFLWFLPAIMIFYILFPFFKKCDENNRLITLLSIIIVWLTVGIIVTHFTNYTAMFIFWNRIPVFLLGYYCANINYFVDMLNSTKTRILCGLVLSVIGFALIYQFAYKSKIHFPIKDIFFVIYIPGSIGLILLIGFIKEFKILKWIGSSTLEMYAIQMIWGYNVSNKIYNASQNILLANVLTIIFVVVSAIVVHIIFNYLLSHASMKNNSDEKS